jgi:uncharacterized protein (DUF1015 family)
LCTVRDDAPLDEAGVAFDDLAALYDANLLARVVIEHALGASEDHVEYVDSQAEAVRRVSDGLRTYAAVFFLRAIPAARIFELALQEVLLPPRTTSLFPRVPSGLVMQSLVGDGHGEGQAT